MEPMTHKQYWINQVGCQIYSLGVNFPRESYLERILPNHTIKRLKKFYFDFKELGMKQEFRLHNTYWKDKTYNTYVRNWEEVRKINSKYYREKERLARKLNQELNYR